MSWRLRGRGQYICRLPSQWDVGDIPVGHLFFRRRQVLARRRLSLGLRGSSLVFVTTCFPAHHVVSQLPQQRHMS